MKILKIIGIILLVIVLAGVGILVFGPSEVHMERQITIEAPANAVFKEVNGYRTFDQFSAWAEIDTAARITIEGPTTGVGAKYSWDSEDPNLGKGSTEIIESEESKMVKSQMSFEGFSGDAYATWFLNEEEGKTNVTYTYDWKEITGFWRFFALATESMLGPMYEETLANLKTRVEGRPQFTMEMSAEEVDPVTFVGIEATTPNHPDDISRVMGDTYGEIMAAITQGGLQMSKGYPLAIYTQYDEKSITMICGIPVVGQASLDSEVASVMKSHDGTAVKAIHKGDYETLEDTHEQISQYAAYYGYKMIGEPWEVYVTDPSMEPDTSKWITEVYYPVN